MENQINRNIKDLIDEYPAIKGVLDEYQIGCVACNVGTCRLADIVDIHNLTSEEEYRLMKSLGNIIYPSGLFEMPAPKSRSAGKTHEIKYSPPMRELVAEHVLIKRLIALIPAIAQYLQSAKDVDLELISNCTDFITQYADRFHHAKEEEILFGYFDNGLDILRVMLCDHKKGRAFVQAIKSALAEGGNNAGRISENLSAYGTLLTEHIEKEDKILYPWMDRILTTGQVGELYSKFRKSDERFEGVACKYEQLINKLEDQFKEV